MKLKSYTPMTAGCTRTGVPTITFNAKAGSSISKEAADKIGLKVGNDPVVDRSLNPSFESFTACSENGGGDPYHKVSPGNRTYNAR